jgi:hypothetical protein
LRKLWNEKINVVRKMVSFNSSVLHLATRLEPRDTPRFDHDPSEGVLAAWVGCAHTLGGFEVVGGLCGDPFLLGAEEGGVKVGALQFVGDVLDLEQHMLEALL